MTGIVESFDRTKGYGFIRPLIGKGPETPCVYFHASGLGRKLDSVPRGAEVEFTLVRGDKGPQCANVRLVKVRLPRTDGEADAT